MLPKEAIAEEWLGRALRTYPSQTAAFLAGQKDGFRNPIGHTLREGLGILLDELTHGMDSERVRAALDSIVQIRAVEDCPPGRALEFLFQLKPLLREHVQGGEWQLLDGRIDEMALLAFDLYVSYRERTYQARTNEARRRLFVVERRAQACRDREGAVVVEQMAQASLPSRDRQGAVTMCEQRGDS